jgi:rhizosphere induced protein
MMFSIGMILYWGGSADRIPPGWMLCDGTLLTVEAYQDLYNVIGEAFGATPPDGQFYLPDLRGQFVRGVDDGSGTDPDLYMRYDMQNSSVKYSGVGSIQQWALLNHDHGYQMVSFSGDNFVIKKGGDLSIDRRNTQIPSALYVSQAETRPTNAALYYIIRVESGA